MAYQIPLEKWVSAVGTVTIGATSSQGGTRTSTVTVGGATTLPFLHEEGEMPNPPAIAMEVLDRKPEGMPAPMEEAFGDALAEPGAWAKKCVEEFGAEMICLRLASAHPDRENTGPDEAVAAVKSVLKAVGVPLIIWGCGHAEKDNEIMPRCSEAAAGENCLLASATQDNYKTLTAACLADGHKIVTEAPIDINIQKQVNILVTDMGLDPGRIVMYQATGGLGYGMEYAYSIMERTRLAALSGDKMLSMPMLAVVGPESWKAKEARLPESEAPQWGPAKQRGIVWEAVTAACFLQGGVDILVMWHPEAAAIMKRTIRALVKEA